MKISYLISRAKFNIICICKSIFYIELNKQFVFFIKITEIITETKYESKSKNQFQ
jgi:hypothetical protein